MKKSIEIIPAIIANTQSELNERLDKVKDIVSTVQLDIMDNRFVPNTSLWFDYLLPESKLIYEAHLMIMHPKKWILTHLETIDIFLVHYESSDDIDSMIKMVKNVEKSIGLVINPETPVEKIYPYVDKIDQILVMTVNPGFYGSPFLPNTLLKIQNLHKLSARIDIEVDGGITDKTISSVAQAGANKFVSGSFIIKSPNPKIAINQLMKIINNISF